MSSARPLSRGWEIIVSLFSLLGVSPKHFTMLVSTTVSQKETTGSETLICGKKTVRGGTVRGGGTVCGRTVCGEGNERGGERCGTGSEWGRERCKEGGVSEGRAGLAGNCKWRFGGRRGGGKGYFLGGGVKRNLFISTDRWGGGGYRRMNTVYAWVYGPNSKMKGPRK